MPRRLKYLPVPHGASSTAAPGPIRRSTRATHARPAGHDLPFSTWSLPKPAEFLVAEEVARRHQP
jgi:hypothetical protein